MTDPDRAQQPPPSAPASSALYVIAGLLAAMLVAWRQLRPTVFGPRSGWLAATGVWLVLTLLAVLAVRLWRRWVTRGEVAAPRALAQAALAWGVGMIIWGTIDHFPRDAALPVALERAAFDLLERATIMAPMALGFGRLMSGGRSRRADSARGAT